MREPAPLSTPRGRPSGRPPARRLELRLLAERLAIVRLPPAAAVPRWARGVFVAVTRTAEELSIVCPERRVPDRLRASHGWRALAVAGPLDLSEVGILAALTAPLAAAGVSVFAVSTFDTDYLLVREDELARALAALAGAGVGVPETA